MTAKQPQEPPIRPCDTEAIERLVQAAEAALVELQGAENPDQRTCYVLSKALASFRAKSE